MCAVPPSTGKRTRYELMSGSGVQRSHVARLHFVKEMVKFGIQITAVYNFLGIFIAVV